MQKELYKEYAFLELQYKELELKRADLRSRILADMVNDNHDKVETNFGKFTKAERVTYSYSEAVDKLTEKLKIKKIQEEKKGVAKEKKSNYLLYTPVKI